MRDDDAGKLRELGENLRRAIPVPPPPKPREDEWR